MLKVKAGNPDMMGLLFERHYRQLYGFLFHMTYRKEASEDMVQHIFYKMLKYSHTFTGMGEFKHWMYSIARNVLKDEFKKDKNRGFHDNVDELADSMPGGTETEGPYEKKEANKELYRAMGKLSDEQREILTLSRFQELRHREIARIMNINEGAVKVRVHRAMLELKKIYKKLEG